MKIYGYGSRNRSYTTLLNLRRQDIVDDLVITTKNWKAAEARLQQQFENVKDWRPERHGFWVEPLGEDRIYCSNCKFEPETDFALAEDVREIGKYHYCPNCGAKMDEEDAQ